jgi:hypothetical protein
MSYDDNIDSSVFFPDDDSTPSAGSDPFTPSARANPVPSSQAHAQSSSAMSGAALTGWLRLLKRESDNSKINVSGKDLAGNITFELGHQAPASVLARASLSVHMLFGSSLQSRLRGLWGDSSFLVDFYIVSDADSPFGISIASSNTSGFHTAPSVHTVDGSTRVSPCIQEGAMSVIILRMLHEGFTSWHSSFFHTAQQCKAAQPLPQEQALKIMKQALDRPCSIAQVDRETSYITTRDEDGYLPISENNLTEGSADFHVRFTVHKGCISAIDIAGEQLTPQRERALHDARLRLGLGNGPLPVSESYAADIIELIMGPLVAKNADATPNLFSYLSAHLALSLKNCLAFANSHTGEPLPRPSVMPFVPLTAVSLYAIDEGLCGLSLQDALCCIPPEILRIVFKSACAASSFDFASRSESSGKKFELCEPWPTFLLKEIVKNQHRSGIIEDATCRADKTQNSLGVRAKGGYPLPELKIAKVQMHAGLGVENKKRDEWLSSVSAVLHALQDRHVINLMTQARSGSPNVEQRRLVLQHFLAVCDGSTDDGSADTTMIQRVAGYILRTLPYFPVQVFDQLLWFGAQTPWEDGLTQDVSHAHARMRLSSLTRFAYSPFW